VALALAAVRVEHRDFARTRHRNQVAGRMLDRLEVVELHRAGGLDRDAVHGGRTRSRAADVEGTHGQLGARLTDRLGGDDAHRLADVDQVPTGQVATVAVRAHAEGRFTGDGRPDLDGLDASVLQLLHPHLVQQGVAGDHRIL